MRLPSVKFTYTIPRECRKASLVAPNGKGSSRGKVFGDDSSHHEKRVGSAAPSAPATEADLPIAQDLLDTLEAHRHSCVGMAANMIGELKRIIVFDDDGSQPGHAESRDHLARRRLRSGRRLPVAFGHAPATRYRTIKVSYQDLAMKPRVKTFTGFTAQIIQHEIDHCNGVLI